jgi:hypothetical protein
MENFFFLLEKCDHITTRSVGIAQGRGTERVYKALFIVRSCFCEHCDDTTSRLLGIT